MANSTQNGLPSQGSIFEQPLTPTPIADETPTGKNEKQDDPLQPEEVSPTVSSTYMAEPDILSQMPDSAAIPPLYEDNKSKFFVIAAVVVFFVITFSVILWFLLGRKGNTAAAPVTLKYWGLWESKTVIQPLIDEFQKQNPGIKIEYEKKTPEQYREKLITQTNGGIGPDLFRYHNAWIPDVKKILAPMPAGVMSVEEFTKTFYPIHSKDLILDKQIIGMPLHTDGMVLVYNEDLLKQAGFTSPPQGWLTDDMQTIPQKITVRDNRGIVTAGFAIGTAENIDHFSELLGIFILINGGDYRKLDDPVAIQALEAYRGFAEGEGSQQGDSVWDSQMPKSVQAFIQGKVAMIIVPSWRVIEILGKNPDLNIKVAPVPVGPNDVRVSIASYWVEGVSRASKHQLEAWKFLQFLTTKENQLKLFEAEMKINKWPFGEPYSRQDLGDTLLSNKYLAPVIEQAKKDEYVTIPFASNTGDNGLNDGIVSALKNAVNATVQGQDYRTAMQTAQQEVSKIFSNFQIQ